MPRLLWIVLYIVITAVIQAFIDSKLGVVTVGEDWACIVSYVCRLATGAGLYIIVFGGSKGV